VIALDASALLALLFRETGHQKVSAVLDQCVVSSLNLSEVLGRFSRDGHEVMPILSALERTALRFAEFDTAQAVLAAELLPHTRKLGLSFGDRACLALALSGRMEAMTADRVWSKLSLAIPIRVIR
jgi:ribonuclease VapC